nr:hypothetical protein [Kibdelosporangium sp. MJ126-NF4]
MNNNGGGIFSTMSCTTRLVEVITDRAATAAQLAATQNGKVKIRRRNRPNVTDTTSTAALPHPDPDRDHAVGNSQRKDPRQQCQHPGAGR